MFKKIFLFCALLAACSREERPSNLNNVLTGSKSDSYLYYFSNGLLVKKRCENIVLDSDINRNCVHIRSTGFKHVYALTNSYYDTTTREIEDDLRLKLMRFTEILQKIEDMIDIEHSGPTDVKSELDKLEADIVRKGLALDRLEQDIAQIEDDLTHNDNPELSRQLVKTKENYFKLKSDISTAKSQYDDLKKKLIESQSDPANVQLTLLMKERTNYQREIEKSRVKQRDDLQTRVYAEQVFKMILDSSLSRLTDDICTDTDPNSICVQSKYVFTKIDRALEE